MDLALGAARDVGADLIIANDPDADRCAVGIPTADDFRMLRGDEVGYFWDGGPPPGHQPVDRWSRRSCRAPCWRP